MGARYGDAMNATDEGHDEPVPGHDPSDAALDRVVPSRARRWWLLVALSIGSAVIATLLGLFGTIGVIAAIAYAVPVVAATLSQVFVRLPWCTAVVYAPFILIGALLASTVPNAIGVAIALTFAILAAEIPFLPSAWERWSMWRAALSAGLLALVFSLAVVLFAHWFPAFRPMGGWEGLLLMFGLAYALIAAAVATITYAIAARAARQP